MLKHHQERVFTHVHVKDRFPIELTVYATELASFPFRSSITGKPIEKVNVEELEALLRREYPGVDLDADVERLDRLDVYELYRMLLAPLENVKGNPKWHPEGDALYHSLQVFELARAERPWDQEFQLAALLHDVGKAIDRGDHVAAAVQALEGSVSDRVLFLVAHHMDAHAYREGTLGERARRRLSASEDLEDLLLLSELDRAGRKRGAAVCGLDEALDHLRSLDEEG